MTGPNGGGGAVGLYARATQLLSLAMVVIGVALIVRLSVLSIVLGMLFFAAGAGRLYVGRSMSAGRDR